MVRVIREKQEKLRKCLFFYYLPACSQQIPKSYICVRRVMLPQFWGRIESKNDFVKSKHSEVKYYPNLDVQLSQNMTL